MSDKNSVKDMKRIDWYLQWAVPLDSYVNTPEEQELVTKFTALYAMAKAAKENNPLVNSENITKWRKNEAIKIIFEIFLKNQNFFFVFACLF